MLTLRISDSECSARWIAAWCAKRFRVSSESLSTIKRWVKRRRAGEDLQPRHSTGRKRRILATTEQKRILWNQLEENDEATLERHCELWEERCGVRVSLATMSRAIREKLGWTLKKRCWVPPTEMRKRKVLGEGT